ncbi:MAG TPA: hypothetical protein VMU71_00460, partial [Terracidiphilus sp.]|nr:hypothetical protein [Terracidiphilus sp.]
VISGVAVNRIFALFQDVLNAQTGPWTQAKESCIGIPKSMEAIQSRIYPTVHGDEHGALRRGIRRVVIV